MNKYLKILFTGLIIITSLPLSAQQFDDSDTELFYTFIGPVIGGGFNHIKYNDWFDNSRGTKNITGNYFTGGVALNIFVNNIIGDFRIQYAYNMNNSDNIQHVAYSVAGKYMFRINNRFFITTGPGFFFESPPSNKDYDGSGGAQLFLGTIYNINFDMRLFFDLSGKYGFYGLGEDSTKLSYGASIGIMFKIGRL